MATDPDPLAAVPVGEQGPELREIPAGTIIRRPFGGEQPAPWIQAGQALMTVCKRCGQPKRMDTWCAATQECRDHADKSIAEERAQWDIRGS
jgi:hypothetical protein